MTRFSIFIVFALLLNTSMSFGDVKCSEAKYVKPPEIGDDRILRVETTTDCSGVNLSVDFKKLHNQFAQTLTQMRLNNPPSKQVFEGLSADYYDVTEQSFDHGVVNIRRDIFITTALQNQFAYISRSREIVAQGDAQLTKKVDFEFRLVKSSEDKFKVWFLERIYVQQKGPAFIFKSVALAHLRDNFKTDLSDTLKTAFP